MFPKFPTSTKTSVVVQQSKVINNIVKPPLSNNRGENRDNSDESGNNFVDGFIVDSGVMKVTEKEIGPGNQQPPVKDDRSVTQKRSPPSNQGFTTSKPAMTDGQTQKNVSLVQAGPGITKPEGV
jgi:hypothetical protein